MRSSTLVKGAALLATTAVIGLSAAPAQAAAHTSQASATALSVTVSGSGTNTGTYTVTNDGDGQQSFGNNRPAIRALGGQRLVSTGTLAQDAVATVNGGTGASAACSGLAGDGATLVAAGDGSCLSGGDTLSLDVASLDFSKLKVLQSGLFQGIDNQLQDALQPYQDRLTSALTSGLTQVVDGLGDPALHLDTGVIQSYCSANGSKTTAASQIAGAGAYIDIPGIGRVDLVNLPVNPAPNTHVVTGLDKVATSIEDALRQQLSTLLKQRLASGPLQGLAPVLSALDGGSSTALDQLDPVLNNVLGQISAQLAPVEDNLLDITLNRQVRGDGSISVTALDARIAPAARQFTGSDLARITIANSICGPNGRIVPTVHHAAPTKPHTKPHAKPQPHKVPTVVTAGLADKPTDDGGAGRTALVALLLLGASGSGVVAYRRALRR